MTNHCLLCEIELAPGEQHIRCRLGKISLTNLHIVLGRLVVVIIGAMMVGARAQNGTFAAPSSAIFQVDDKQEIVQIARDVLLARTPINVPDGALAKLAKQYLAEPATVEKVIIKTIEDGLSHELECGWGAQQVLSWIVGDRAVGIARHLLRSCVDGHSQSMRTLVEVIRRRGSAVDVGFLRMRRGEIHDQGTQRSIDAAVDELKTAVAFESDEFFVGRITLPSCLAARSGSPAMLCQGLHVLRRPELSDVDVAVQGCVRDAMIKLTDGDVDRLLEMTIESRHIPLYMNGVMVDQTGPMGDGMINELIAERAPVVFKWLHDHSSVEIWGMMIDELGDRGFDGEVRSHSQEIYNYLVSHAPEFVETPYLDSAAGWIATRASLVLQRSEGELELLAAVNWSTIHHHRRTSTRAFALYLHRQLPFGAVLTLDEYIFAADDEFQQFSQRQVEEIEAALADAKCRYHYDYSSSRFARN